MPKINVYLSDELATAVRDAHVPVSAICQAALERAVRGVNALRVPRMRRPTSHPTRARRPGRSHALPRGARRGGDRPTDRRGEAAQLHRHRAPPARRDRRGRQPRDQGVGVARHRDRRPPRGARRSIAPATAPVPNASRSPRCSRPVSSSPYARRWDSATTTSAASTSSSDCSRPKTGSRAKCSPYGCRHHAK